MGDSDPGVIEMNALKGVSRFFVIFVLWTTTKFFQIYALR